MKNKFLIFILFCYTMLISVSCGEDYKKVILVSNGDTSVTVEDFANNMAGANGEYSFFKPD
ncbi:MAG: hypothetical protein II558_06080, partial [Treponema sp.]|nr:hypothetical protein [Treponema sp.]